MKWLLGTKALSTVEYVVLGAIILALVGSAIWNLAGAVAQKFNEYAGNL